MTMTLRRSIIASLMLGILALFIFVLNPYMVVPQLKTWVATFLIVEFFILAYAHKHKKAWITYLFPLTFMVSGISLVIVGLLGGPTLGSGLALSMGLTLIVISLLILLMQHKLSQLTRPDFTSKVQTRAQQTYETLCIVLWMLVILSSHMWMYHFTGDMMVERMMLMISIGMLVLVGIYVILIKGLKKQLDPTLLSLISMMFFTLFYSLIGNSESSASMMLASSILTMMLFIVRPEIKGDKRRARN